MDSDPKSPLRVGVVGGGLIAQLAHLPLLHEAREAELHALVEPDRRVRESVGERFGIKAVFEDHRAMLDSCALDAVVVCSPNETHAEVTLTAVEMGCAVLVEKPLCLDPADGHAIAEAARRKDVVVHVGYMKQFDPSVRRFLASLPQDDLHRVDSATVDNAIGRRFRPAGFIASGHGGARRPSAYSLAFCGALIHDVNLVLEALDRLGLGVARVIGAAGADDATFAACTFDLTGGAQWTASWRLEPEAPRFSETLHLEFARGSRTLSIPEPYEDVWRTYGPQLRHFIDRIRDHDVALDSVFAATRDVSLLAEAYSRARAVPA